jgi:hypothetical protein
MTLPSPGRDSSKAHSAQKDLDRGMAALQGLQGSRKQDIAE